MSSENPHRFATLLRWNTSDCLFSVFKKDFMEIEDEKETGMMMCMFV